MDKSTLSFREFFGISEGTELDRYDVILIKQLLLIERGEGFVPLDLSLFKDVYEALPDLMVEAHLYGGISIPSEWFPENNVVSIPSTKILPWQPRWSVTIHHNFCAYDGQYNKAFSELLNYTNYLINKEKTIDRASSSIYGAIDWCLLHGDIGGAIDGLTILNLLPVGNPLVTVVLDDIISVDSPGLKMGIGKLLEKHMCDKDKYIEELRDLAINADCEAISLAPIRALRIVGGEKCFYALLEVAGKSKVENTSKLATRAIAWIKNYNEIEKQLKRLLFSKDKTLAKVASFALNERINHNILSYGGLRLATDVEIAEEEQKESV